MNWTDTRVELLKKLWADGLSATQIANELGGITRNAVIGKVHRIGLQGGPRAKINTPTRPRVHRLKRRPCAAVLSRAPLAATEEMPAPVEPITEMVPAEIIEFGARGGLLDLSATTCRWPVGDPQDADFRYCGATCLEGAPYCAGHSRIAYQPRVARRAARAGGRA